MANDIGVGGQFFIDGQDISPLLSAFRHTSVTGNVDTTRLRAPGRYRSHAVTLRGGSVGITGDLPDDDAQALIALNGYLEHQSIPHVIFQAPFGADFGKLVRLGKALRTSAEMNTEIEAVLSLNAEFEKTAGSPGVLSGQCLFTPNGESGTFAQSQKNTLTFNGADSNQFFALRAVGTSETFAFTTATTNSQFKAGVEALAAYAGRTVTVTGATLSGPSTAKVGQKDFVFNGTASAPDFEVISGAVRRRQVASGNGGSYSFDGGATFTIPITQSNFDANQKAIGAAYASSVSIGSSSGAASTSQATGGTPASSPAPASSAISTLFDGAPADGSVCGFVEGGRISYTFGSGVLRSINQWGFRQEDSYSTGNYITAARLYGIDESGTRTLIDSRIGIASNLTTDQLWSISPTAPTHGYEIEIVNTFLGGESNLAALKEIYFNVSNTITLDFTTYFPVGAAPASAAQTGTGASNTVLAVAGASPTTLTAARVTLGDTLTDLNVITSATLGAALRDIAAGTTTSAGMLCSLQAVVLSGSATCTIEHAPDSAGSPGTWATLYTFTTLTAPGALYGEVPAGTAINPWIRARVTSVTGSIAVAIGFARRF